MNTENQMDQQEFDNKVADIFVSGRGFVETWENIGKLYCNLKSEDKFLAFNSKLLKNWMDSHSKELTEYILSE